MRLPIPSFILLPFMLLSCSQGQNLRKNSSSNDFDRKIEDSIRAELDFDDSIRLLDKVYYGEGEYATHAYAFIDYNNHSKFHAGLRQSFLDMEIYYPKENMRRDAIIADSAQIEIPRELIARWIPVYLYKGNWYVYSKCEFQFSFEVTDSTFVKYYMDGGYPEGIKSLTQPANTNGVNIITAGGDSVFMKPAVPSLYIYKVTFSGLHCHYIPLDKIHNFHIIEAHCHDEDAISVEFDDMGCEK